MKLAVAAHPNTIVAPDSGFEEVHERRGGGGGGRHATDQITGGVLRIFAE